MNELQKMLEMVKEFHDKFKYAYSETPTQEYNLKKDRYLLMASENDEYDKASNLTDTADAIFDMWYVLIGTTISHGFTVESLMEGFKEVHRSNMTKTYTGNSKPQKGDDYSRPDLTPIITKYIP